MQACAVCRKRPHDVCCGMIIYATAECPICLETTSPLVALPCGHVVCAEDFARLGGVIKTEPAENTRSVRARDASPQSPYSFLTVSDAGDASGFDDHSPAGLESPYSILGVMSDEEEEAIVFTPDYAPEAEELSQL